MENINQLRIDLKAQGYALIRYDDGPVHSYPYDSPWLSDPEFTRVYESIRRNTLVDRLRCYSLYLLTKQVASLPGNVLEVGVWRGGTAGLLAQMLPHKTVYAADTFKGVVKASGWEHYENSAHSDTSLNLVTEFLRGDLGLPNIAILEGIFPEDTGAAVTGDRFALVHLDVDVYESTKDAFNFIWSKIVPGGIVAFDDYGMLSACAGVSRFVDEISTEPDKLFIQNSNGQAYLIKR